MNPVETPNETPEAAPSTAPTEAEALKAQLAEANAKAAENWDKFLRATAEMDNYRRRAEREATAFHKYALERVLGDLLAVADSLDLAVQAASDGKTDARSLAEGLKLKHKQFFSVLEKHGVNVLDPRGEPFNSDLHQAVSMLETAEVPPNHVVNVLQKGYRLHERVLRPAMVVVAKSPVGTGLNGGVPPPDIGF